MFCVKIQLISYAAHLAVGAEACITKTYERRVSCIWPTIKVLLVLALHSEKKKLTCFTEPITMATTDPAKESSMQETKSRDQDMMEK